MNVVGNPSNKISLNAYSWKPQEIVVLVEGMEENNIHFDLTHK